MILQNRTDWISGGELIEVLRAMQDRIGERALAVVRIPIGERRFVWSTLGSPSCGLPGLPVGQDRDLRFSTDGTDGLHGQVMVTRGAVDFHLDRPSACIDPVRHGLNDTELAKGALLGALLGGLAGALLGDSKVAARAAAGGAMAGASIGAMVEKRPRRIFEFEAIFGNRLSAVGLLAA